MDAVLILEHLQEEIQSNIQVFGNLDTQLKSFSTLSTTQNISKYSEIMFEKLDVVSSVYLKSAETFETLLKEVQRNFYFANNARRDVNEILLIIDAFLQNKEKTIFKMYEVFVG
jgi:hypothetical protein